LPGRLKNLLDCGSRPYANGPFAGKPVAVISTSTGRYGGARAVEATSDILRHIGASVLNDRLTVASAQSKIDSEGVLRDDITKRSLAHIVERLRDLAKFGVAA
jgi:chromate reductase